MEDHKTNQIVEALMEMLGCPQRKVALLAGLDPHTLTNNREATLRDLTPRTRQHLINLYSVVLAIGPLRPEVMLATLERHTYKDHKGRMDSVVSAIQQDKYDLVLLLKIAEKAKKELTAEWTSSYPKLTESEASVSA